MNKKSPDSGPFFVEYILLAIMFFALFLCISRPVLGVRLSLTPLKHLPLLLFLPTFVLYLIGHGISQGKYPRAKNIFSSLWPFLLLGLYATLGSLYASYVNGEGENFLTLGTYLLLMPAFYTWGANSARPEQHIQPLMLIWGISCGIAVMGATLRIGSADTESLHEIEFMVLPFFLYCYFASKTKGAKFLSLTLLIFSALITNKLTGYFVGIGALFYIFITYIKSTTTIQWQKFIYVLSLIFIISTITLIILGFIFFKEYLPSGNAEVRMKQYAAVFGAFLESPLWGQAYTSGSGQVFREGVRSLNIPTHSDVLDLLKQGGLIAFTLWLVGVSRSIRLTSLLSNGTGKVTAYFHAMTFMTIATIFSYTFNPLLLQAPFSFVIWGFQALVLGYGTSIIAKD